jgi:hypothetical protein
LIEERDSEGKFGPKKRDVSFDVLDGIESRVDGSVSHCLRAGMRQIITSCVKLNKLVYGDVIV